MLLSLFLVSILGLASRSPDPPLERHLAIVLPAGWEIPGLGRSIGFARRNGIEIRLARDRERFDPGWEVARFAAPPVPDAFRKRLARFPVTLKSSGFVFDGRAYLEARDAVVLSDPDRPFETLVLGNSRDAAMRAARSILWNGKRAPGEFRAISGELSKEGRFRRGRAGALEIDRTSGRDRIADRERFFADLASERRGSVVWRRRLALPRE